jgi:hypothetical protein
MCSSRQRFRCGVSGVKSNCRGNAKRLKALEDEQLDGNQRAVVLLGLGLRHEPDLLFAGDGRIFRLADYAHVSEEPYLTSATPFVDLRDMTLNKYGHRHQRCAGETPALQSKTTTT